MENGQLLSRVDRFCKPNFARLISGCHAAVKRPCPTLRTPARVYMRTLNIFFGSSPPANSENLKPAFFNASEMPATRNGLPAFSKTSRTAAASAPRGDFARPRPRLERRRPTRAIALLPLPEDSSFSSFPSSASISTRILRASFSLCVSSTIGHFLARIDLCDKQNQAA